MKKYKKIGIIVAMNTEAEQIIQHAQYSVVTEHSGIKFTEAKIRGTDVVIAVCGIGKVFAAICAQTMILLYHTDCIINTGVAGSLTEKLSVCDIALADELVQHDMDTTPLGDPPGLISGINKVFLPADGELNSMLVSSLDASGIKYLRGIIASGDRFVANTIIKRSIAEKFRAIACEMEGAAIAQVCYINDVPFSVLRSISDGGDESSVIDYPEFVKKASAANADVLLRFFEHQGNCSAKG